MALERVGDGFYDGGRRHHAHLHGGRPDILEHDVDLLRDERRIDVEHARHAQRVLRGERRDRRLGEQAVRGDGLDIGLDSRASFLAIRWIKALTSNAKQNRSRSWRAPPFLPIMPNCNGDKAVA